MATLSDFDLTGYATPPPVLATVTAGGSGNVYQSGVTGNISGDISFGAGVTISRIRIEQNGRDVKLNRTGGGSFNANGGVGARILLVTDSGQGEWLSGTVGNGFANYHQYDSSVQRGYANAITTGTVFGFAMAFLAGGGNDEMSGYYDIRNPRSKLTITQYITDATPTVKRINAAGSAYETVSTGTTLTAFLATIDTAKVFIDSGSAVKVIYFEDF